MSGGSARVCAIAGVISSTARWRPASPRAAPGPGRPGPPLAKKRAIPSRGLPTDVPSATPSGQPSVACIVSVTSSSVGVRPSWVASSAAVSSALNASAVLLADAELVPHVAGGVVGDGDDPSRLQIPSRSAAGNRPSRPVGAWMCTVWPCASDWRMRSWTGHHVGALEL